MIYTFEISKGSHQLLKVSLGKGSKKDVKSVAWKEKYEGNFEVTTSRKYRFFTCGGFSRGDGGTCNGSKKA